MKIIDDLNKQLNEIIKYMQEDKIKSAENMFAKLGYKRYVYKNFYGRVTDIVYDDQQQVLPRIIKFDLINGHLEMENVDYITIEEIKAINQECLEDGWLDKE